MLTLQGVGFWEVYEPCVIGQCKRSTTLLNAFSCQSFLQLLTLQGVGFWEVYEPGQDAPLSKGT